jgi:hypothetical protein
VRRTLFSCALWALSWLGAEAHAQAVLRPGPVPHTYALLVGKNPGGPGQQDLRYAEQDARRMAELLRELGRVPADRIELLLGPDRAGVLAALRELGTKLAVHRSRGEQAQVVFYYSGHARATAIHLGDEELALSELRAELLALPSTLTLIVLDACQSGAFSSVKGAAPAAEFSYNSVARLQTQGVAVMASSSATELSQESSALRGSYFTHHLMVALRGAGDADGDGTVSLSESYRYAYDRTLSSTMRTAVGRQHVTLETALEGHGDVPITYPAEARAQLELPAELAADVLVERGVEHGAAVVAELHKARGAALRLALPAGAYTVVLRAGDAISSCAASLRDGAVTRVQPAGCSELDAEAAAAKGYFGADAIELESRRPRERFGLELGLGAGSVGQGAYTDRLADFGFAEQQLVEGAFLRLALAGTLQLSDHLSAVVDLRNLDHRRYQRTLLAGTSADPEERFAWWSFALGAHLRAHVDLGGDLFRLFAQLGGGAGYVQSELDGYVDRQLGPHLGAGAGAFYMPARHFGLGLQLSYAYAPMLANEIGDHHDNGGLALLVSLRYRSWER